MPAELADGLALALRKALPADHRGTRPNDLGSPLPGLACPGTRLMCASTIRQPRLRCVVVSRRRAPWVRPRSSRPIQPGRVYRLRAWWRFRSTKGLRELPANWPTQTTALPQPNWGAATRPVRALAGAVDENEPSRRRRETTASTRELGKSGNEAARAASWNAPAHADRHGQGCPPPREAAVAGKATRRHRGRLIWRCRWRPSGRKELQVDRRGRAPTVGTGDGRGRIQPRR